LEKSLNETVEDDVDLKLTGKVALVTGSTAGIGFAIAKSLASEGAHIYVNGRSQQRVDARWRQSDRMLPRPRLMALRRTFLAQPAQRP
jgi:NAD(P)-dependent dehydrogenase (short-subunit alcohol dehydrogenase family)